MKKEDRQNSQQDTGAENKGDGSDQQQNQTGSFSPNEQGGETLQAGLGRDLMNGTENLDDMETYSDFAGGTADKMTDENTD